MSLLLRRLVVDRPVPIRPIPDDCRRGVSITKDEEDELYDGPADDTIERRLRADSGRWGSANDDVDDDDDADDTFGAAAAPAAVDLEDAPTVIFEKDETDSSNARFSISVQKGSSGFRLKA